MTDAKSEPRSPQPPWWGRLPPSVIVAAVVVATAPFVYTVFDDNDGDIPLYHRAATSLIAGTLPYRDFAFEYPPYALVWFGVPAIAPSYAAFRILFALQLLALDVAAKVLLWREARRLATTPARAYAPVLVFAIGGIFQAYFYLKRLDVIAATLSLFAIVAFTRARHAWSGALIAFAVGTKLYPVLLAPALFWIAVRRGKGGAFVLGGVLGILPIAIASFALPWWKFASFHAARGLQVETTYASILWLLHLVGLDAQWVGRPAWMEVDGPAARALLPIARVMFGAATIGSVVLSVVRAPRDATAPRIARVVLVPILAFMAFNIVLSPQYVIWLLPIAGLAAIDGARAPIVAIGIATVLTMFLFPAPDYIAGYGWPRACILALRNASLLAALAMFVRELFARDVTHTLTPSRRARPANEHASAR